MPWFNLFAAVICLLAYAIRLPGHPTPICDTLNFIFGVLNLLLWVNSLCDWLQRRWRWWFLDHINDTWWPKAYGLPSLEKSEWTRYDR